MTDPSHTRVISLFSGSRGYTDYNDADDSDHDRWWLPEIIVCIVISWGCAIWTLTAVGVG